MKRLPRRAQFFVRRGIALYLAVLSTALIVSLLGLSALNLVRIQRRQIEVTMERRDARANARSACTQNAVATYCASAPT